MLKDIFCLEGTITVPDSISSKTHTAIFKRIHSIIGQFDINVGLSYPEYDNNINKSVLGTKFRVFGTMEDLAFFKRDRDLASLSEDGFLRLRQIDIPSEYTKVKYVRDRTRDNYYNKNNSRRKEPEEFPFIPLKSFSNKNNYTIKIKKVVVKDLNDSEFIFNSFGLSTKQSNSWLPDF